jgi:peptide/nickel transport system substrate-binding protein
LARQLSDFGFQVSIALLQDVPLTKALQQKQFDLALLSQSHQGNPDRFRTLLSSHQGNGDQYLMNTELIQLLEQMRHQPHLEQRESMMIQAERLYNADLPSLPLVNPINFAAQRPGSGAAFTPGGIAMGVPLPLNKLSLFRPDMALGLMDTP